MRLDPERVESMIICHDFWMKRDSQTNFKLCNKCPKPPAKEAKYNIMCSKHN
jgi:hypothetical protein